MKNLSWQILNELDHDLVEVPSMAVRDLPEKVIQFGTGVLLRALPDYFIDKANKLGIFNGRVVVIKSTSQGDASGFENQDNLYTHCIRAVSNDLLIEKNIINASISRVISASSAWPEVLKCAENSQLQIVISNTTEVGLVLVKEPVINVIPSSFPGKLLSFLYHRYQYFNGTPDSGMIIIPSELIVDNGIFLKNILLELAAFNELEEEFVTWLVDHNSFCNSLVDRIVPGKLPQEKEQEVQRSLGYADDLMIMSEDYALWAIETSDEAVRKKLSFSKVDRRVIIEPDIDKFRELKLRILNGSHSFSCGLAVLAGFKTVKEAMANARFEAFIRKLIFDEIIPCVVSDEIREEEAVAFATEVLDRYRNPFIEHQWLSISLQYSGKMKTRTIPLITRFEQKFGSAASAMSLGFAAYLVFMRTQKTADGFVSATEGFGYTVKDDAAGQLHDLWLELMCSGDYQSLVTKNQLWPDEFRSLHEFPKLISQNIQSILSEGAPSVLAGFYANHGQGATVKN